MELEKVLQKMGFGARFISWVHMLHQGAQTQFLLNFLTRPVEVLLSVRQGDPVAMCLWVEDPGHQDQEGGGGSPLVPGGW